MLSYLYSNKHEYLQISNIMQYSNKETLLTEENLQSNSYTFILKKMINNYRVPEVSVNFPIVSRSLAQQQNQKSDLDSVPMNSYPVFNHDKKYFTPCFIVDADRYKVQKYTDFYLNCHFKKVQEVDDVKSQILVAKPSKNHSTCSLCKINYLDYSQHINSEGHMAKQKKSRIGKNIQALYKLMAKKQRRRLRNQRKLQRQIKKQKRIKKQKQTNKNSKPKRQDFKQSSQITEIEILMNIKVQL